MTTFKRIRRSETIEEIVREVAACALGAVGAARLARVRILARSVVAEWDEEQAEARAQALVRRRGKRLA